jgi:signal transduction histidine kinase
LNRTAIVALVTLAALGVPCAAWYVAGSRAARQQADDLRSAPLRAAQTEAQRSADRIAMRLEALRQTETRRSFLDYQLPEDPLPVASCETAVGSPLAQGPADPLIWAHFQIDEHGRLTLPGLEPQTVTGPERQRAIEELTRQHAILEVLECAAADRLASLPQTLDTSSEQEIRGADESWVVTVGAFHWHTLELDDGAALVAVRGVRLPASTRTQGFIIRPGQLETLLDASSTAAIRPGTPAGPTEVRIPLEDEAWIVALDASAAVEQAGGAARAVVRRFHVIFGVGAFVALLAGALVVGIVRQSERLSLQRARFAASAAHELRTPLAGIRMYAEMLADHTGDPEHAPRYSRHIAGEADRLGRVVSNLLGFSRLEKGELLLDCEAGDLSDAVRHSLDQLGPTLEAHGARLDVAIDERLPPTRFNRDAVHQILQNLLDNAEKFTRAAANRTIEVALGKAAEGAALSVTDHGPGIEPSLRGRMFRPFVRHPAGNAPAGLGLGLTLVDALARAQDARVAYAEPSGGGVRFTVLFKGTGG